MKPAVSIIVPIWCVQPELAELTLSFADSLFGNTEEPFELILVDNHPGEDGEVARKIQKKARRHDRPCVVLTPDGNIGVGPAWNLGLVAARAPVVGMLNADLEMGVRWLPPLLAALDREGIAFAAPASTNPGSCFVGKRTTFDALLETGPNGDTPHYFDPRFAPFYFEESDMFLRATHAGFGIAIVPDSPVRHFTSSFTGIHPQRQKVWNRTLRAYEEKWGNDPKAREIRFVRL